MKFAPDPLPASVLAHRAQVVTANINVAARLRVAAHRNNSSAPPGTLEPAIIVNNVANALVKAVERSLDPVSPHGLADSAKGISMRPDITAGLGIRYARTIPAIPISNTIVVAVSIAVPVSAAVAIPVMIVVATVVHAAELAIDVFNRAAATGEGFQGSVHPSAIAVLAAGAQKVIAYANVAAGLAVSAGRHYAVFVANQVAIIVGNIAPAAVGGIQKCIMKVSASVLATRAEVVAPQAYVFAGLLIRPRRIVIHCSSAGFLRPKDQQCEQGNQRQISH